MRYIACMGMTVIEMCCTSIYEADNSLIVHLSCGYTYVYQCLNESFVIIAYLLSSAALCSFIPDCTYIILGWTEMSNCHPSVRVF